MIVDLFVDVTCEGSEDFSQTQTKKIENQGFCGSPKWKIRINLIIDILYERVSGPLTHILLCTLILK